MSEPDEFAELMRRSSLGSPGARRAIDRTPQAQAGHIRKIRRLRAVVARNPGSAEAFRATRELVLLLDLLGYDWRTEVPDEVLRWALFHAPEPEPDGDDSWWVVERTQHAAAQTPAGLYPDIDLGLAGTRMPLMLVIDTSSSMSRVMGDLNSALASWAQSLAEDPLLAASVDIAMITFGGEVTLWQGPRPLSDEQPALSPSPFVPAATFDPPHLRAHGVTPTARALREAIDTLADYKARLRQAGRTYYRPQILLVTDGYPSDEQGHASHAYRELLPQLREDEAARRYRLFTIGVGDQSAGAQQVLAELSPRYHAWLTGFPITQLLTTVSHTARAASSGADETTFQEIFDHLKH
ncbi:vWA domain-containing protein [Streptomyces sp. NPDC003832]